MSNQKRKKQLQKQDQRAIQKTNRPQAIRFKCSTQALFLLFIGVKRMVFGATFNNLVSKIETSTSLSLACNSPSHFVFYSVFYKESATIYSFNLDAASVAGAPKLISNEYGVYEPGSQCHMHTNQIDKDKPVFVFVFQGNGDTFNKCKLVKIITRGPIETCSGSPVLLTTGPFEFRQNNHSPGTAALFSILFRELTPHANYYLMDNVLVTLEDGSFDPASSIDDDFLGMLLMHTVRDSQPIPVTMIKYQDFTNVNTYASQNSFAVEVKAGDAVQRLIRDDLPGYYLDVYNGNPVTDDSSKVLRRVMNYAGQRTFQVQFYIAKPAQIAQGETHTIKFIGKVYRTAGSQTLVQKEFEYNIEMTRTATHINFVVKRGTTHITQLDIAKAYTGGNKFIYVNFNIGKGILYWIDTSNAQSKTYETLHVFEVGQTVQSKVNSFTASEKIEDVISIKTSSTGFSLLGYLSVQYIPHTGVTTNKAGYRVITLTNLVGVVPPSLVANLNPANYHDRCYYPSVESGECIAMAILSDPTENQLLDYLDLNTRTVKTASGAFAMGCKVVASPTKCLIPMPNYISNLEWDGDSPLPNNGNMLLADYQALTDSKPKDFFAEYTSSSGNKYLVACPTSCGKCSPTTLQCSECADGATVTGAGTCPLTGCNSISGCSKCDVGGLCSWCGSSTTAKLQPDKNSCSTTCPAGSGLRFPDAPKECLTCTSHARCQTCSNGFETCEACTNSAHKFMVQADKARLPSGKIFLGQKDCFDPAEITDYFYVDGNDFKPCKANCKKCSLGTDCSECGNHLDTTGNYYIDNASSPPVCLSATQCSAANNKFPIPGSSPPTCHECPAGQFYVDGSNPPQCSGCGTSGTFLEAATNLCKACPSGCSSCTSATSCQACTDRNHFLQSDGTCNAECPAGRMGVSGSPNTCQVCGTGCTDCQHAGCQACQAGLELQGVECVEVEPVSSNSKVEVLEQSYTDYPSKIRLLFNQKIESSVSLTNVEIELTKKNSEEKIATNVTDVELEGSKKALKIFFDPETDGFEQAKLTVSFKEPNLIWAEGDPNNPFPDQKVQFKEGASSFRPENQIGFTRATAIASSTTFSALGVVSLIGSYSSIFDLIKTFQMLDYLIYYNVDHPSNLQVFLKNIEFTLLEKLPNPLKGLKDKVCYVEKEKFEEDEMTCYMLSDQGRYFSLTAIFFLYSMLLRVASCIWKKESLKKHVKNNFGMEFWLDFLEAIRFEIFIVVLLSLGKISLLRGHIMSKFALNIVASVAFAGLNVCAIFHQFSKINENYQKNTKSKKKVGSAKGDTEKTFAKIEEDKGSQKFVLNHNNNNNLSNIGSLGRLNEKQLLKSQEQDVQVGFKNIDFDEKITEKETSQKIQKEYKDINPQNSEEKEDKKGEYKQDCFYQRNHQPIMGIKEILSISIIVAFYNFPALQSFGVTATLATILILDFYYKPFTNPKDNLDLAFTNTIFTLISLCLSCLSFSHKILSKKASFYIIGYTTILLVCLLIARNISMALLGVYQALKRMCKKKKKRIEVSKMSKRSIDSSINEPSEGVKNEDKKEEEILVNKADDETHEKKANEEDPLNQQVNLDEEEEEKVEEGEEKIEDEEKNDVWNLPKQSVARRIPRMGQGGVPRLLFKPKKKGELMKPNRSRGTRKDHKI